MGDQLFQTASTARHPFRSAFAGQNQHIWTYAHLTINRPWFYSTYDLHTNEGNCLETILLSSVDQVVDLLNRNGNEISVRELLLVSPDYLNDSGSWKMEPLSEIWIGQVRRRTSHAFAYRLKDGREYVDSPGLMKPGKLSDLTCIASFKRTTES